MDHFFEPAPDQLIYHYTTAKGADAILRGNGIWLSEFSMMNDKSEYEYAKYNFIDNYRNREVWIEEIPRLISTQFLIGHASNTVRMIGCFTEDCDDAGLWDRYADQGRGCVLGLDARWLAERAGVKVRRVSYDPDYLKDFVNSGLMILQTQYEENQTDLPALRSLAADLILDLYAFKDPRFHSESEIRVSRLTEIDVGALHGLVDHGGHRIDGTTTPSLPIKIRLGRYGSTRFLELPLLDTSGKSAIRSVTLGPGIEPVNEELIQRVLQHSKTIEVFRSDLPLR